MKKEILEASAFDDIENYAAQMGHTSIKPLNEEVVKDFTRACRDIDTNPTFFYHLVPLIRYLYFLTTDLAGEMTGGIPTSLAMQAKRQDGSVNVWEYQQIVKQIMQQSPTFSPYCKHTLPLLNQLMEITGEINQHKIKALGTYRTHNEISMSVDGYEGYSDWELVQDAILWLEDIINPANWHGQPPYFIWGDRSYAREITRLFQPSRDGDTWIWMSGFGGRLIVFEHDKLTPDQKREMWNWLLTEERVYDNDPAIACKTRVTEAMIAAIPAEIHGQALDLAGGTGFLASRLKVKRSDLDIILFDNADQAVAEARRQGIESRVADLDQGIPVENESVAVATIAYAVHWLDQNKIFENVYQILKPGGLLIFNVYPPILEEAVYLTDLTQKSGFSISCQHIEETDDYIIVAKKA